jgi:hypothetical protein
MNPDIENIMGRKVLETTSHKIMTIDTFNTQLICE